MNKTANPTFKRPYHWTISKTANQSNLTLSVNGLHLSNSADLS
ncbi:MAG: hypothetical protein U0350_04105 [Caldilineaceae bacterium]